jgi:O-antigen/teichoic acid export membrane protein
MNTSLAKNYAVFFTGTGLSAVAGLASSIIYNWTFPPELLGRYNLVNSSWLVLYAFICGWLISSFFRYYLEYRNFLQQSQLFNVIFSILLTANIVLLLLLFTIYSFVNSNEYCFMIFVFAFNILPRCLVELFSTKFKLDNSMKGYFLITVFNSFGIPAISLVLIFAAGLGIFSLILAPVAVNGLIILLLALKYRSFFKLSFNKGIIKDFWQYGGPLIVTGLINVGLALSDRYIVRYFFSDREVGIYSYAYDLSEKFFKIFVNVFALTIQTYLMQVWQDRRDDYNKAVKTFTRYYYIAFIPLVFIVDILLDFMFGNILNKQYIEGRNFTLVVLAAMFFEGLLNIANRGFAVHKKTKYLRNAALIAVIINILLNLTLMPVFGFATAAYTTLAAYISYLVLVYVFSVKKINWRWEFYNKVILTSGSFWIAAYLLIRHIPLYSVKLALLALFCILYLFILPKDVKQLLNNYKHVLLKKIDKRMYIK